MTKLINRIRKMWLFARLLWAKRRPLWPCPVCGGDYVGMLAETGVMCPMCRGNAMISERKRDKLLNNLIGEPHGK